MSARILIVDDDPVQRRLLKGAVEREGMIADTADDGNQAVKLITNAEKPYDAVVLDLVMPGMDGLSVLAWMSENGHGTPAIVQTGLGGSRPWSRPCAPVLSISWSSRFHRSA